MSVPTFLQNKTYSTNTAATSHSLTLSSTTRPQGGTLGPTTLILTLSYDGAGGDQCSSVTDTSGNTWQKGTSASNGATTSGEMWYSYNIIGGATPTITANMASSVKMTMVCVEIDQVRPVSPLDLTSARIDTTSSTARTSAATLATKRQGMIEVIVAGIAWSSATLNCSNGGTGFAGTLVTTKDATSGIGVGMARRAAETNNLTGSNSIGRFTMSARSTTPAAVMCLSFFRDGVITSNSDDGWIDNIEGVASVYTTDTQHFVYTSSTSAPFGGTGGSERASSYHFFPAYSSYLLPGVTLDTTFLYYYSSGGGYDDGTNYEGITLSIFIGNELGSTLDADDEFVYPALRYYLGTAPCIAGLQSVVLNTAANLNLNGITASGMRFEGDTGGGTSGTYCYINSWEGNAPSYLVLNLIYPVLVSPTSVDKWSPSLAHVTRQRRRAASYAAFFPSTFTPAGFPEQVVNVADRNVSFGAMIRNFLSSSNARTLIINTADRTYTFETNERSFTLTTNDRSKSHKALDRTYIFKSSKTT